jgi:hypothetical protein
MVNNILLIIISEVIHSGNKNNQIVKKISDNNEYEIDNYTLSSFYVI